MISEPISKRDHPDDSIITKRKRKYKIFEINDKTYKNKEETIDMKDAIHNDYLDIPKTNSHIDKDGGRVVDFVKIPEKNFMEESFAPEEDINVVLSSPNFMLAIKTAGS